MLPVTATCTEQRGKGTWCVFFIHEWSTQPFDLIRVTASFHQTIILHLTYNIHSIFNYTTNIFLSCGLVNDSTLVWLAVWRWRLQMVCMSWWLTMGDVQHRVSASAISFSRTWAKWQVRLIYLEHSSTSMLQYWFQFMKPHHDFQICCFNSFFWINARWLYSPITLHAMSQPCGDSLYFWVTC